MPTKDELYNQLRRFLPDYYDVLDPVLWAMAAAMEVAADTSDDLADSATIEGAEGAFLTLLARGYGIIRATSESDDTLRTRLRNVEDKATRGAILDAVNAILAPFTGDQAEMREHWDAGIFLDDEAYVDDPETVLYNEHNAFTLLVPALEDVSTQDFYVDQSYADQSYTDAAPSDFSTVYAAIIAEVERLRAAGIRWWLVISPELSSVGAAFLDGESYVDQSYITEA